MARAHYHYSAWRPVEAWPMNHHIILNYYYYRKHGHPNIEKCIKDSVKNIFRFFHLKNNIIYVFLNLKNHFWCKSLILFFSQWLESGEKKRDR
jgi:hypothetical protein